jgi:hypothetical protein
MSQTPEQWSPERLVEKLFHLASELSSDPEAVRERREEKRRMLLSAGVLFPSEESWEERGLGMMMMADINPSYPGGVSPRGGTGDSAVPGKCRL